jgi:hypothetical protein
MVNIEYWYLKYNEEITKEVFNKIINYLNSIGYIQKDHCCGLTYERFIQNKFLRSKNETNSLVFCIDNNSQEYLFPKMIEIFIKDFELNKELQIEIW